jgi:hypothetical protein
MILLLSLAAFAMLAAGTRRQAALIFAQLRSSLLVGGYALLVLSLVMTLSGDDPAGAAVSWVGELTVASVLVLLACCFAVRT